MNEQQHIPVEDLAAYAAGDLDATAALAVETHVLLCESCRAGVEALHHTAAALGSVERVTMPADVAARLDAAIEAERVTPVPNVTPMHRRRRPSFAGLAAVAAGFAFLVAIAVPLVRNSDNSDKATTAASGPRTGTARTLASNLNYTHANLAATLERAISGASEPDMAFQPASPAPAAPVPADTPAAGAGEDTTTEKSAASSRTALVPLRSQPARLSACVAALAVGQPPAGQIPLLLDYARYAGQPALLVVLPTITSGQVDTTRVDVFVVGPRCGVTPGDDDVLTFSRIRRPNGL